MPSTPGLLGSTDHAVAECDVDCFAEWEALYRNLCGKHAEGGLNDVQYGSEMKDTFGGGNGREYGLFREAMHAGGGSGSENSADTAWQSQWLALQSWRQ